MLVSCAAYQDGGKRTNIEKKDISDYVRRPECLVWVALYNPEPAELSEMREEFDLHELAVEDARHGHQRPEIEEYGDSLFAVLHTVEAEDGDINIGKVDVFVGPNYLLSVRSNVESLYELKQKLMTLKHAALRIHSVGASTASDLNLKSLVPVHQSIVSLQYAIISLHNCGIRNIIAIFPVA